MNKLKLEGADIVYMIVTVIGFMMFVGSYWFKDSKELGIKSIELVGTTSGLYFAYKKNGSSSPPSS